MGYILYLTAAMLLDVASSSHERLKPVKLGPGFLSYRELQAVEALTSKEEYIGTTYKYDFERKVNVPADFWNTEESKSNYVKEIDGNIVVTQTLYTIPPGDRITEVNGKKDDIIDHLAGFAGKPDGIKIKGLRSGFEPGNASHALFNDNEELQKQFSEEFCNIPTDFRLDDEVTFAACSKYHREGREVTGIIVAINLSAPKYDVKLSSSGKVVTAARHEFERRFLYEKIQYTLKMAIQAQSRLEVEVDVQNLRAQIVEYTKEHMAALCGKGIANGLPLHQDAANDMRQDKAKDINEILYVVNMALKTKYGGGDYLYSHKIPQSLLGGDHSDSEDDEDFTNLLEEQLQELGEYVTRVKFKRGTLFLHDSQLPHGVGKVTENIQGELHRIQLLLTGYKVRIIGDTKVHAAHRKVLKEFRDQRTRSEIESSGA